MNKIIFQSLLLLIGLSMISCDRAKIDGPDCIQMKIQDSEQKGEEDVVLVWEYKLDGEKYYGIVPGCCDRFTELYDEDCNLICYPSGGLTGGGAGDCPEWTDELGKGRLVWEKP